MTDFFLRILNMSLMASYVVIAVLVGRLFLKRAPKLFSYILWSAVAVRLILPVELTSNFSLFRWLQPQTGKEFTASASLVLGKMPDVHTKVTEISHFVDSSPLPINTGGPIQMIIWIGSAIWVTGVVVLLLNSIISYVRLMKRVRTATRLKDHVFETDRIDTPFVSGFLQPKIYIPSGIGEKELSYILLHEQTHIRRRDYIIKPFAFALVIVHWFNPLMWLSFALMSKDMEMSCDESVVAKMGHHIKRNYSTSLMSFSVNRSRLNGKLSFGESDVKARIKNILAYRSPSALSIVCSILFVVAFVAGCSTNPIPVQPVSQTYYAGYNLDQLMENKTPYVGNNSKVGGLIGSMPLPAGFKVKALELETKAQPYGVIIHCATDGSVTTNATNSDAFYRNSILLLSLIDNVDHITYSIADGDLSEVSSFTFTREQAEELLGEDVRQYADDEADLQNLIDRLDNLELIE